MVDKVNRNPGQWLGLNGSTSGRNQSNHFNFLRMTTLSPLMPFPLFPWMTIDLCDLWTIPTMIIDANCPHHGQPIGGSFKKPGGMPSVGIATMASLNTGPQTKTYTLIKHQTGLWKVLSLLGWFVDLNSFWWWIGILVIAVSISTAEKKEVVWSVIIFIYSWWGRSSWQAHVQIDK